MDTNFEQKVRERAYHIWMSAGMADGMAHEHWVLAEQAVVNETETPVKKTAKAATKSVSAKVTTKTAKPAAKPATKSAPKSTRPTRATAAKSKH